EDPSRRGFFSVLPSQAGTVFGIKREAVRGPKEPFSVGTPDEYGFVEGSSAVGGYVLAFQTLQKGENGMEWVTKENCISLRS
ncbi:MAG: hypothetical protein SOT34_02810, partial [Candidatus Borkfalkiaceae bacterium]|nr:hypothetical protein [Christensenellaceae bacterium]